MGHCSQPGVTWGGRGGVGAGLAFAPLGTRPTRVARLSRLEQQRPSCVSREVFEWQLLWGMFLSMRISTALCWNLPSAEAVHLCISMHRCIQKLLNHY